MVETTPLKERLLKFIKSQNLTQSEFQRICGLANSQVQNTGETITSKTANKILTAFPNLNKLWLLTGYGDMLKTSKLKDNMGLNLDENTSVSGRLKQFLMEKDIKISHFEREIGVGNGYVNSISKGIGQKVALSIQEKYPNLNIEWLLYGKGTMLKTAANEETAAVAAKDKNLIFVPLYNLDVHAGMNGLNDVIDCSEYIERHIVFDGARKDDIAFHVFGDSMIPKYVAGSIVLCREVQCWQEYFGYGSTFVLFLTDGRRLLKTVKKSLEDEKKNVLCCSFNSAYDSEELPKSLIIKVFKVIGSLTKDDF